MRKQQFATPVLEDITHGQRENSRLFHTREENGLPFYYNPRHVTRNKISVACSNNYFAKCDAKFFLNSKNPTNIIKVERDNKKPFSNSIMIQVVLIQIVYMSSLFN